MFHSYFLPCFKAWECFEISPRGQICWERWGSYETWKADISALRKNQGICCEPSDTPWNDDNEKQIFFSSPAVWTWGESTTHGISWILVLLCRWISPASMIFHVLLLSAVGWKPERSLTIPWIKCTSFCSLIYYFGQSVQFRLGFRTVRLLRTYSSQIYIWITFLLTLLDCSNEVFYIWS